MNNNSYVIIETGNELLTFRKMTKALLLGRGII